MNVSTVEEPRFLTRQGMSNYEDSYNAVFHESGLCDAYFPHYHDYYEISFYLGKNSGIYMMNNEEYEVSQGDIMLCGLFEPHLVMCRENASHERFNIGVDPRMLLSFSSKDDSLLRIFDKNKSRYPILHLDFWEFSKYRELIQKFREFDIRHGKEMGEKALIYQMLVYLYDDSYESGMKDSVNLKHIELIAQLIRYIETHLENPITLDELAEKTNYSAAHICRVFKEETGETLIHYILEKRLQKAKCLLIGDLPISEIALQTGFNSYSYFYRAFKKSTGIGPEEYRRSKA